MCLLHFDRVAGVVPIHRKGGDEDRAVDADLVHRLHHLVTRDVVGPVRHTLPRPTRRVRLIDMDLRIYDRHGRSLPLGGYMILQQVAPTGPRSREQPTLLGSDGQGRTYFPMSLPLPRAAEERYAPGGGDALVASSCEVG